MQRISFDFNNMMASRIGACHGIREEEIEELIPRINSALDTVLQRKWAFMNLPYDTGLVDRIKGMRIECDNFVVIGIGGSSLGNRALHNALNHPFHTKPRIFILENVDPTTINGLMDVIDFKRTIFNVITKSGTTVETMANFMVLKAKIQDKAQIIITTDPTEGELRKIANDEGYTTLDIPSEVGGRFSVFSSVGLLSAAVSGIDIRELLEGARFMDGMSKNKDIWKNPACMSAVLQYIFYKRGRNISVFMPYSDRLRDLAEWFCQLWAESLGKCENVGSAPVRTLGVIDQHSQLQLYMEGPQDKVITFVRIKDFGTTIEIPRDFHKYLGISYLGGHTINELILAEQLATEIALTKNKRPNCTITLENISPFTIGALMYMLEIQTAFIGELFGIDAFDQPGVEEGKKITNALLGRPGYEKKRKEIEELPEIKDRYIIPCGT